MNVELTNGSLYLTEDNEIIPLGLGIPFTEEVKLSADEKLPRTYFFNTPQLSFEAENIEFTEYGKSWFSEQHQYNFIIEYEIPIMIQARWHKKKRINKKWLKRYGMKPDVVKVKSNANVGEYHPDDSTFECDVDNIEYIFRPDQKRKHLKIEW